MSVMELNVGQLLTLFFVSFLSPSYSLKPNGTSTSTLDSLIKEYAFSVLSNHPTATGAVYKVPLPSNLSGIEAMVVRLRRNTLRKEGQNVSQFHIPPGTIPVPSTKHLALVYQNLGSVSSSYYDIPGHSLISPIIGLLAYDASNLSSSERATVVDLISTKGFITVRFSKFTVPRGMNSMVKCAGIRTQGHVLIYNTTAGSTCTAKNTGHLAVVVPSAFAIPPVVEAEQDKKERKGRRWRVWVVACGGLALLLILGLVFTGVAATVKRKRINLMQRKADEGETLKTTWITGSRIPSASIMRTRPVIEN